MRLLPSGALVQGNEPGGLLSCLPETAIMWAGNPSRERAGSKGSGLWAARPLLPLPRGVLSEAVDRRAPPGFRELCLPKHAAGWTWPVGSGLLTLVGKNLRRKVGGGGGGRSSHGDVYGLRGRPHRAPSRGRFPECRCQGRRSVPAHGAEPEHAEDNSEQTALAGKKTEISTRGLEDRVCVTMTAPSWRARAPHPASPGSQLLPQGTWRCKGLGRIPNNPAP